MARDVFAVARQKFKMSPIDLHHRKTADDDRLFLTRRTAEQIVSSSPPRNTAHASSVFLQDRMIAKMSRVVFAEQQDYCVQRHISDQKDI